MSTTSVSRKSGENPCPPTLSDLLKRVDADETQSKRLKQDIASALRTIAKAMGCPVGEAPAEPVYIRSRLKEFAPASLGIKESTWANVLSLHKKALAIAGVEDCERKRVPLALEWSDALELVTDDSLKSARWRICAFGRYCSVTGIRPDEVDDATLEAYREHRGRTEYSRSPEVIHRELCVAWNKVVDAVPQWPQQKVQIPHYKQTYSLGWEDFPKSLRDEVDRYLSYLGDDDPLTGCPRPFRPASLKNRRDTLRTWLSAIVINGRDVATLTSLRDAVQLDVYTEALRFFLGRGAKDKNVQLAKRYADAIIPLAKYWLKVDDKHVAALKEVRDRLKRGTDGPTMGEKSRERLKQFDDPQQILALVTLPQRLIAKMPKGRTPTPREALRFQTAVAIEIALLTTFRLKNLAGIEIGRHLTWIGKGRKTMRLSFPAEEVKNGVAMLRVIAPESAKMIEEYINRYRPVLLKSPSNHLFPGEKGGGKQKGGLSKQISDCIRRETGIVMHVHLFRHFAATTLLDAYPGAYGIVRLLHGHKSVDTTTKFYTSGSEAKAAFRHYDQHIASLRRGERDGAVPPKHGERSR